MTREQLYNLVWSKPMTHIAKEFGMSDVAIRKHCKKLDIATPYVGYRAKLEHGKRVRKPPLSTKKFPANELVDLSPKPRPDESAESRQAAEAAKARLDQMRAQLAIPDRLPRQPQRLVQRTRERLKQARPDNHGFRSIGSTYQPTISVGTDSIQRVLHILSALCKGTENEGHCLFEKQDEYFWQVRNEKFDLRIYETKSKKAHEPTHAELKAQAQEDKWREEHPNWYSTKRKVYRTWDYCPSGRLTLLLSASERYDWRDELIEHRWRDRKSKSLEQSLADVFVWLASAEALVRERRLKHEEKLRIEAEARERRRIERERHNKAKELEQYIAGLLDIRKTETNVSELLQWLSHQQTGEDWATNRLIKELCSYQDYLQSKTCETAIAAALNSIGLDQVAPLLIPHLET